MCGAHALSHGLFQPHLGVQGAVIENVTVHAAGGKLLFELLLRAAFLSLCKATTKGAPESVWYTSDDQVCVQCPLSDAASADTIRENPIPQSSAHSPASACTCSRDAIPALSERSNASEGYGHEMLLLTASCSDAGAAHARLA